MLVGHVHPALWIQVSHQEFYGSTERVIPMLDAMLFQQPQHAIDIGCASYIHGSFGQFIYGGEIACEPVPVGEIETIAPGLEKGLTRFQTKAECHLVALGIPTVSSGRHTQKHKYWHQKRYHGELSCVTHALSPLNAHTLIWHSACTIA